MGPTVALTLASLKMYYRNRQAIFFSLFLPLLIIGIFGLLNLDAFSGVDVGIVDEARNEASGTLLQRLEDTEVFDVIVGPREVQIGELEDGHLDLLAILPEGLFNANRPQRAQVGAAILSRALDDLTFQATGAARLFELETREVNSREFDYVDFLVPGVVAMSIMQMGLFGVVF